MPKHGQKIAPVGVDKEHKCGLYSNSLTRYICTYCCYYCEQRETCKNACSNTAERCGKDVFERSGTDGNDKV